MGFVALWLFVTLDRAREGARELNQGVAQESLVWCSPSFSGTGLFLGRSSGFFAGLITPCRAPGSCCIRLPCTLAREIQFSLAGRGGCHCPQQC